MIPTSTPVTPTERAEVIPCLASDITIDTNEDTLAEPTCHLVAGSSTAKAIELATHHLTDLRRPVVIPTETVYGLAASAVDEDAIAQIFSTKGRPADNPLIVHISSLQMLHSLLPESYILPVTYDRLIRAFWPGPLTLLFPADPQKIPSIITAGQSTVAIRMPSHPVCRALISISQTPLAAPSANSSGRPSPTKAEHVWNDIGSNGKVGLILDGGPCDVGVESTVVDGISGEGVVKVLRPGGVTVEQIEEVLNRDLAPEETAPRVLVHKRDYQDTELEQNPTTPGMKYLHYTPSVPVILVNSPGLGGAHSEEESQSLTQVIEDLVNQTEKAALTRATSVPPKIGLLFTTQSPLLQQLPSPDAVTILLRDLGPRDHPEVAAQRLFDGLLSLEKDGADFILVEAVEETREGLAVMNRLKKAASEVRFISI